MAPSVAKLLLWLFVVDLGIALGAGLYEARIVVPQWFGYTQELGYRWNADAALRANTGLRFWLYVTTLPLTLLTLANAFAAWRARGALRAWWLGASLVAVAERAFTFGYFIPTMVELERSVDLSETEALALATQWADLNDLRHVLVLAAWLAALKAFALWYARGGLAAAAPAKEPGEAKEVKEPPEPA